MSASPTPSAPAGGGKKKFLWIIVCLVCIVGGAALPMVTDVSSMKGKEEKPKKVKTAPVPFGDVVVNLSEERMTRYLRVKIVLLVDEEQEHHISEHLPKIKAAMKNWLISHLAGKTLKDVSGTVGVKRLQREILEKFEEMMSHDGDSHLHDILFEEFTVQ
jgi:flagellar basal body-associated protein FliL